MDPTAYAYMSTPGHPHSKMFSASDILLSIIYASRKKCLHAIIIILFVNWTLRRFGFITRPGHYVKEGLNTVQYTLLSVDRFSLYTRLYISIPPKQQVIGKKVQPKKQVTGEKVQPSKQVTGLTGESMPPKQQVKEEKVHPKKQIRGEKVQHYTKPFRDKRKGEVKKGVEEKPKPKKRCSARQNRKERGC